MIKQILLSLCLLLIISTLRAQIENDQFILSKEGQRLQKKSIMLSLCAKEYASTRDNKTVNQLCSCQISLLDRRYSNAQITRYTKKFGEDAFSHLISEDSALQHQLQECQNSVTQESLLSIPSYRQSFISNCVKSLKKSADSAKINEAQLTQYCSCAADIMNQRNISVQRLDELSDPSSFLYNEVAYKCGSPFLKASDFAQQWHTSDSIDVTGRQMDTIQLLSVWGMHKAKLTIGGITKIWLLDTGASDLLLSESYGTDLMKNGVISDTNFIGDGEYVLADNKHITCKRYKINGIQFGKFTINNVVVAVSKEAKELLLGKSLLNKFTQWTLDNKGNLLMLKK